MGVSGELSWSILIRMERTANETPVVISKTIATAMANGLILIGFFMVGDGFDMLVHPLEACDTKSPGKSPLPTFGVESRHAEGL
jgi:hypothetical protein